MNEHDLLEKHFVKQPDGSWRKASPAERGRVHHADDARLHSAVTQQTFAPPLVGSKSGEGESRGGVGKRYRVTWTVYSVKPMDWDNVAGGIKAIQDCAVEAGWIPDDGWKVLEGVVVSEKCSSKSEQRTEMKLERIA